VNAADRYKLAGHEPQKAGNGDMAYDPIAEAVRLARAGLSVTPFRLIGRDKKPALGGPWPDTATSKINHVVEDFELAVQRHGAENVLVGWAVGKDGYVAIDDDHGLPESIAEITSTPHAVNPTPRGRHLVFRNPDGMTPGNGASNFPDSSFGEVRGRGGCIIVAGADRPGFDPDQLAHVAAFPRPDWLTEAGGQVAAADGKQVTDFLAAHATDTLADHVERIIERCKSDTDLPSRHQRLIKYGCWLMRDARTGAVSARSAKRALWRFWTESGVEQDRPRTWRSEFDDAIAYGIGAALRESDDEIADRAAKLGMLQVAARVEPAVAPCTLAGCIATYRRWLHLPDPDQVTAVLGAVAANLLDGDPLWLLLVGSSGSGKTETIDPLDSLPYVHKAATLTEPALLSGSSKRDSEKGATGGLLRQVGDFGIILAKDFGSVLSMHREGRGQTLAALREIADGSWVRPIGTAGGRVLRWSGKCGLVGAVTPVIDRHYAVIGALGERFILYRLAVDNPHAQARRRLANRGKERQMRDELAAAAAGVLTAAANADAPKLGDDDIDRLVDLAVFVVWARTPVERDGYNQEVVAMPSREAPARLAGALGQLLAGLDAIGADADTRWRIIQKCAWDCVPDLRCRLLHALRRLSESRTAELVTDTGIPKSTVDRILEDLALLGLNHRGKAGTHDTAAWTHRLADEALEAWPSFPREVGWGRETVKPQAPGYVSLPLPDNDDFSGEAP
jgi:hypothetical protein